MVSASAISTRPPRPAAALRTAWTLGVAVLLTGRTASAVTAEVRAETVGQAYQLRGPYGAPVLSFRRLTQTLSLGVHDRSDNPRGYLLTVRARLRIDADFGAACDPATDRCLDEVNRARGAEFSPLFVRRAVDLPWAYLDLERLGGGRVDVRAGRQLVVDPLGFLLFDGARVRLRLGDRLHFDAYGGLETRAGFPLSNGRYTRDGLAFADRTGWDTTLAPQVLPRALAWLAGGGVDLHELGPLNARLAWRTVRGEAGVVEEKLGASVDLQLSRRARLVTEAVYSVPQAQLAWASLAFELAAGRRLLGVEVARSRPVFDLTSIWASFWVDPTDDVRAHGEWPLGEHATLVLGALLRRYALDAATTAALANRGAADRAQWAAGASAGLSYRRSRGDGGARVTAEHGDIASRAGGDVTGRWWIRPGRVRVDVGASVWWTRDALRPERDLASVGVVAGALVRLGAVADVHVTLEDDINRVVGHRLRAMGVLALRGPF